MANIDEALLNRPTLSESEQLRAAGQLREDNAQERLSATAGAEENETGDTLGQKKSIAKMAKEAGKPGAEASSAGGSSGGASSATSRFLKQAWINMLDPFAIPLALAYINLHVFGHSVFGEKIFCSLGEEWLPNNLQSGSGSETFKNAAKKIGLLEKIGLIFLDLIAIIVPLILAVIIIGIMSLSPSTIVNSGLETLSASPGYSTYADQTMLQQFHAPGSPGN
ncbi:MAG: hypothetical protein PHO56_04470 [Patescibacteria group bacterium]|nr:hypothetical protein [Patescibacteria group bacterium]